MTAPKRRTAKKPQERLGEALAEHMTEDFEAHGADLLSTLRDHKPVEYLKLLQSILTGATEKDAPRGRQINVIERRIISPGDGHS
jgi:hypothetical protein